MNGYERRLSTLWRPTPLRALSEMVGLLGADVERCAIISGDVTLGGNSSGMLFVRRRQTLLGEGFDIDGRAALIPWIERQLRSPLDIWLWRVSAKWFEALHEGGQPMRTEDARGLAAKMADDLHRLRGN